ncbi:ribonuclease H-like domain-containing protein, partial [Tanacetum coccineum]
MDDLYNNMKKYETKVKGSSSLNQNSHNVSFVSSNNSGSSNQAYGSNSTNVDSMSDVVIYSFFANQSNSLQLNDEDLQQIDADDLGEMDLKWQIAMLTMRARRFLNKTGRKINANGSKTIGSPRENRNKEHVRRNVTVETIETKALVVQDGLGYDWSDQAEEGPTNFELMAYTSLGSSSSSSSDSEVSTCSKACLKSYETLKEHYDNLTKDFNKYQINVGAYKAGLESIEARLDVYKKNEVVFEEDIKILKLDIKLRDNALTELRKKFEKAKKERDDLKLTLEKFGNSSKNLSKLLEIQVSDKFKTGVGFDSQVFDSQENDRYKTSKGYHVVPPPYTGNFMPPKYDLVLADEGEYVFSESVTSIPDVTTSEAKTSVSKPKYVSEPLIEDWISDSEDENETEFKTKQRKPSFAKVEFVKSKEHVKTPRESVKEVENNKQAKYPRKNSQSPRDCDIYEKKMVEKPVWNNARKVNHQNSQRMSHPHPKINFVPKAVLIKSSLKTLNTARQNSSRVAVSVNTTRPINTAYTRPTVNCARPALNVFNRAHSHVRRPFNKFTTNKKSNFNEKVNTVKGNVRQNSSRVAVSVNTTRPINTAYTRPTVNCARPASNVFNRAHSHVRIPFNKFTTNKKSNFNEKVNTVKGNVTTFGPKAVINDNKGNETNAVKASAYPRDEHGTRPCSCYWLNVFVLSPDFKLLDENHVLLRVPRKDNMYSVDLKNIVPSGGLTCLFAKATLDESKLWHRRLGHINFKTINKLVKGNLVRGNLVVLWTPQQNEVAERKNMTLLEAQQNGVVERKNKTLIEASRTMLADSKLPTNFWAEAVNTACYVQNRVLVTKPHNKTPYELFLGYSTNSKAFRVFNSRTRIVEENLHVKFSKETPNIAGNGPNWLFDIDALTKSMNYKPVVVGNQSNGIAGEEEKKDVQHLENEDSKVPNTEEPRVNQDIEDNVVDENTFYGCADDPNMPNLEEIVYLKDDEGVGAEADMNNLDTFMLVGPIPTTRIHKDHPFEQIIGDLHSAPQTRRMTK